MPEFVSRYANDPLVRARDTHRGEYRGHPDGLCCVACEGPDMHEHVTFPCPVVNEKRCEFTFDNWRCIQRKHRGKRHLVATNYGARMVAWPA